MLSRLLRGWRPLLTQKTDPLLAPDFRRSLCEHFCAQDAAAVERALSEVLPPAPRVRVAFDPAVVQHPMSCFWSLSQERGSRFTFPAFQAGQLLEVVVERWLSLFDLFFAAEREIGRDGSTMISFNDLAAEPGLGFCGNALGHILLPDFAFLQSHGYSEARQHFARNQPVWAERSPLVFWRGSSVGQKDHSILEMPRARLCRLAQEMGEEWGDVGLVELFHISAADADQLRQARLLKPKVSWKELTSYRFHIDIDGHASSFTGLFLKLLSGGLVLKVQSPDRCVQWYYDRLIPEVNFVPVRSDLSDLVEIVSHYRQHPRVAAEIVRRGRELALSLTFENEFAFALRAVARALSTTAL